MTGEIDTDPLPMAGDGSVPEPGHRRRSRAERILLAYAHPGAARAWGLLALGLLLDVLSAPYGPLPFLVLVADAPFLWLLGPASGGRWKRWAWLYGMLHFGVSLWWLSNIYVAHALGAAVILGPVYLLAGLAIRALARRGVPWLLAVPTVLVFEELVRTIWMGGMPWPARSLAFVAWPTLVASSAWLGAYGLSFLAGMTSALAAGPPDGPRFGRRGWLPWAARRVALPLAVVVLLWTGGAVRASRSDAWAATPGSVVVVQGNIPQSLKHSQAEESPKVIFDRHLYLSREALRMHAPDVSLVMWPETMVPWVFVDRELALRFPEVWENEIRVLQNLRDVNDASAADPLFLIGAIYSFRRGEERHPILIRYGTHDSLFLLHPGHVPMTSPLDLDPPDPEDVRPPWLLGRHDKRVLVPGGEYTPLGDVLPPLRWFRNLISVIPELDPGAEDQAPLPLATARDPAGRPLDVKGGTVICFEIAFPAACRAWRRRGAHVLLNAANYGWFGETGFRAQIRAIAALRAAETAATVVMGGNTGPTLFFDPLGRPYGSFHGASAEDRWVSMAPLGSDHTTHRPGWATAPLFADPELTPYVRWGDVPWYVLGLLVVGLALRRSRSAPGVTEGRHEESETSGPEEREIL
ncbi:MAG: apolipoprotein N-acyltransferase [Planctomycetota bacterium]|jgi:apolipoprotein N-acyltransferase